MLVTIILILISIAGTIGSLFYFRKNLLRIRKKNESEPKPYKRALNYPLTCLWYGYLLVFFIGLTVNNLIFK